MKLGQILHVDMFSYSQFVKILLIKVSCLPHSSKFFPVKILHYTVAIVFREDMKSLPYTTMCIKEAMRLYPPVPHYFRDLSEDTIINGSLIPKGLTDLLTSWLVIIILYARDLLLTTI